MDGREISESNSLQRCHLQVDCLVWRKRLCVFLHQCYSAYRKQPGRKCDSSNWPLDERIFCLPEAVRQPASGVFPVFHLTVSQHTSLWMAQGCFGTHASLYLNQHQGTTTLYWKSGKYKASGIFPEMVGRWLTFLIGIEFFRIRFSFISFHSTEVEIVGVAS